MSSTPPLPYTARPPSPQSPPPSPSEPPSARPSSPAQASFTEALGYSPIDVKDKDFLKKALKGYAISRYFDTDLFPYGMVYGVIGSGDKPKKPSRYDFHNIQHVEAFADKAKQDLENMQEWFKKFKADQGKTEEGTASGSRFAEHL